MRSLFYLITSAVMALAALPAYAANKDSTPAQTQVRAFAQRVGDQALGVIAEKSLSKEQKQKKLEAVFSDGVDIPWVSRFVLGRYWRTANETQRTAYQKSYEAFVLRFYSARFSEYTGGSFKILDVKNDGNGEYTVPMEIQAGNSGNPIILQYRIHKDTTNRWQIFDVIVEGVSMITTQRAEFASVLSEKGLDTLIEKLKERAAKAADK